MRTPRRSSLAVAAFLSIAAARAAAQAPSPAEELRRKAAAAAALKKGLELRTQACEQFAESLGYNGAQRAVLLRLADCKRLAGELTRAAALVEKATGTLRATTKKTVDEPRAAALSRVADERWAAACNQFAQSLRGDVTLEAAEQVVTCQLARGELSEARALLAAVVPTLATLPPKLAKRQQPIVAALSSEVDRLQPYLTLVSRGGASEAFSVDGHPAASGQVLPLDPGEHTVVAHAPDRSSSFTVTLQLSEKRVLSLADELEKRAAAEFAAGAELLAAACKEYERVANSPLAGAPALERLATCKRLGGEHTSADALWASSDAMLAGAVAAPHRAELAASLQVADDNLRKACARFQASLDLDADLAAQLAAAACLIRDGKLRPAKQRLEQLLLPPSPLATPRDALRRNQAQLARMLLADVDRMQPQIRVEPAPGFQGEVTINRFVIEPNTAVVVDPGHYIVLQVPRRGPRVVHELVIGERERVVFKHNLRCNAIGKACVDPEQQRKADAAASSP